ncbi:ATP-binding protein [Phenylobacterium sp.]|uniref:ATP-binding protein n=1 Tax=Phenylobacterium sp. TaxID=1871053 RepID=UPI002734DFDE|nr:ATP-binding protein [Phenylobacterium sp.]MDP3659821.1 ATP-binding protein [Phenylobacterium sp.]
MRRLLGLGAIVVIIVLLGSAAMLALASTAVDRLQSQEERFLVQRTLERLEERLARDITTASVWDQAYAKLSPGGDLEWADAEIGTYFANNRGHDRTMVFDSADRPFYAFEQGRRTAPAAMRQFELDVRPMLTGMRAVERRSRHPSQDRRPTDPGLATTTRGVLKSGGHYYLVAASTVTPEVWSAPRRPGPAVIVVSAQRMDGQFLSALKQELRVQEASIQPQAQAGKDMLPIVDINGHAVGSITWQAHRPGLEVLRSAAPVIVMGFLALLAAATALAFRVRSIVMRLDANEASLSQAIADLVRARDAAQDANRAKSEFLANMSHEIRTPLNGVLGMVQVLERSDLGSPHAERLKIVRDSGETLLAVLNDILDLSKIEAGRMELETGDFDLEETINAVCRPFAGLAARKDVAFDIAIEPSALGIWRGDAVRIRQVVGNLASNAVKFTDHGCVRVEVACAPGGLQLTISDTGLGITKDSMPRLFSKFVQADASVTRRFGGTGLGLSICRELVEMMGGALAVSSTEGVGSTFTLTLPLVRGSAAVASAARKDGPAEPEHLAVRILAADDNTTNQMLLQALLEPLGVKLTLAADGREAVAAFKAGAFDVVLMDIQMPEMDGVEAAQAMRAIEAARAGPQTPILALSANAMTHQIEGYLAAGMNGFVAKPINAALLLSAIQDAINADDAVTTEPNSSQHVA